MTRSSHLVLAALCGISGISFVSTALAGGNTSPHSTAIDADKDGAFVATVDVNSDGTVDYMDIGVNANQYDCDDFVATTNPKAPERPYDNVDNDCNSATTDAVTGMSEAQFNLFLVNEYGNHRPTTALVEHEVGQCASDATACTVNMHSGRFEVLTPTVKVFEDIFVNGSLILRNSGQKPDGRELVTVEQFEHFRGGSASGSASGSGGLGRASVTKIADESATAATGVLREEMLRADSELDGRVDSLETTSEALVEVVNIHTGAITDLEAGLAAQDDRIEAETARAQAAEAEALRVARSAQSDAYEASRQSDEALSHGVIVEGYGLGGIVTGSPTTRGERNSFGGGTGAGFNVGADLPTARVNVFGDLLVGHDGSDLMHSESVGLESTFQLGSSSVHLGPSVAYTSRFSQDNLLESAVVGRGPLVGLTLAAPFAQNGAGHGLFQVRAGCGPEWVGVKGDDVGEGVGLGCRATVGIGGGVGAPR